MAKTLEEINQAFYIQWYLSGREQPSTPAWMEPPPPSQPPHDEVEQWIQELINDPDLKEAEDLLDAALTKDALLLATQRPQPWWGEPQQQPPKAQDKQRTGMWKSVSNILFYAALFAIVIGAMVLGGKSGGGTQLFGFRYFDVKTGSMQSVIPQGSLVITRQMPSEQIKVGDIITFLRSDEENVTHRVIEIVPDFDGRGTLGFRTQGSDNPEPDPDVVGAANVIGVVKVHVKGLGFTLRYIAENIKYVFLIFLLVILTSIAMRVLLGEKKNIEVKDENDKEKEDERVKQLQWGSSARKRAVTI